MLFTRRKIMETKQCGKCGENKPLEAFAKRERSPDKRQAYCRVCNNANGKKFREQNPDYYKEWNKEHPDYHKKYYKERKETQQWQ